MAFNLQYDLFEFNDFQSALVDENTMKAASAMVNSLWYNQTGSRAKRNVWIMKNNKLPAMNIILHAKLLEYFQNNDVDQVLKNTYNEIYGYILCLDLCVFCVCS